MRWTATSLFAVTAGLLAPVTASAQLEIAPQLGLYIPNGDLIKEGGPSNPALWHEKRPEGSILLGVRGYYWATTRLGVVATASYAPSPVAVTDSTGTTDQSGGVLFAHTQLLVVLTSSHAPWAIHVGVGGAILRRTGSQWQYSSGATAPALLVSLGAGTPLSWGMIKPRDPRHQRDPILRLEVADYISHAQFDQGLPTETPALTHHDFTASIIFSFPVGHR